jgi:hypothetical protein
VLHAREGGPRRRSLADLSREFEKSIPTIRKAVRIAESRQASAAAGSPSAAGEPAGAVA